MMITYEMAEVVKRLRPRIVVPICVGSNPIFRPILKEAHSESLFLYYEYNTTVEAESF